MSPGINTRRERNIEGFNKYGNLPRSLGKSVTGYRKWSTAVLIPRLAQTMQANRARTSLPERASISSTCAQYIPRNVSQKNAPSLYCRVILRTTATKPHLISSKKIKPTNSLSSRQSDPMPPIQAAVNPLERRDPLDHCCCDAVLDPPKPIPTYI